VPIGEGVSVRERTEGAVAVVEVDDIGDRVAARRHDRLGENLGCAVAVEVGEGQVLDVVEALEVRVLRQPGRGLVTEGAVPVADQDLDNATQVAVGVAVVCVRRGVGRGDDQIDMSVVIEIRRFDVQRLGRCSERLCRQGSRLQVEMSRTVVEKNL
jgi:hypothetical protein